MNSSAKYAVTTITKIDELGEVRAYWERMQDHPNIDFDQYKNVVTGLDNVVRPHITIVYKNGSPDVMSVGRIENYKVACKYGYKEIYQKVLKALVIMYRGVIGELTEENCNVLIKEYLRVLKDNDAQIIVLSNLTLDSILYKKIEENKETYLTERNLVENLHWQMTMPSSMADFYKGRSSKHRYWLKRINNILDKEYPSRVNLKCFREVNEIDILCKDSESVARKTYQRELNAGFIDDGKMRNMVSMLLEKQRLRAYLLYIDERPSAFWIGSQYGDIFHLSYTGYDPDMKKYELGTIVFLKMLEDLVKDKVIKYLDFGFGDAPYKSRFCDRSWSEATVFMMPKNVLGLKLYIIRNLTAMSYTVTVNILNRLNMLNKIKRVWRERLTQKKTDNKQ